MIQPTLHKCVIIGAGFSGICLGIQLKKAGINDFVILEKRGEVGGTWRDNHYPGAECDVPSALYSFSFETKTDWDYTWSEQPQILDYIKATVRRHELTQHIRCNKAVREANYNPGSARWLLRLADGETLETQFLVSAVGQLHEPNIPNIPGRESFSGPSFHSANWQHDVDLRGKSVAVIGNAASAVQFIPELAKHAAQLSVFQRSANWVARKRDMPYSERQKNLRRALPVLQKLTRLKIYLRNEWLVFPGLRGNRLSRWLLRQSCLSYLDSVVTDAELRRKLLPDYPIGAKRILVVEGYYEALMRENVALVDTPIRAIEPGGVRTADGTLTPCDVLVYGTGFVTNPFLHGITIRGESGTPLAQHWQRGARAYLGIATAGFPNLFFLYGPNTNLGHNSILLMSESQSRLIVQAIQLVDANAVRALQVRAEAERAYDDRLQHRLRHMVWSEVAQSWYKTDDRITNNWPGSAGEYRRATRRLRQRDFLLTP
ncbi:MAG: NAD(P)/FAD-dependent oxidoreductase [Halioglobus sp.]|nr:NAD(P)/FAD-dependent oxidoreductase [Halioglobus sp.]